MPERTPLMLLALALLCLPACSSNEGSSSARTSTPTARATGTTDPGSRFLQAGGAVGAIAVESSPLEGRYVAVPRGQAVPSGGWGQQPPAPAPGGALPAPNVYPIPPAPSLPVTDR